MHSPELLRPQALTTVRKSRSRLWRSLNGQLRARAQTRAAEYKSEATQLREKAQHHRKLAGHYKGRMPPKGSGNYANVTQHCEKLAKYYEDAAKEADAVASELSKQ